MSVIRAIIQPDGNIWPAHVVMDGGSGGWLDGWLDGGVDGWMDGCAYLSAG